MPRQNKRWTSRDIEYMRLMYPTEPARIIAAELGTTYQKLVKALERNGISKPNRKKHNPRTKVNQEKENVTSGIN